MKFKSLASRSLVALLSLALLGGCGGGGGGGGGDDGDDGGGGGGGTPEFVGPSPSGKSTVSGLVIQGNGNPLASAKAVVVATQQSVKTDATGQFILAEVGAGRHVIKIDGSTATGVPGGAFGSVDVTVDVPFAAAVSLETVVLHNLNSPDTTKAPMPVNAGGNTTGPTDATNADLSVTGAAGTNVRTPPGTPPGTVQMSATPVSPRDLPAPLPEGAGVSLAYFALISPVRVEFTPGLSIRFQNTKGLPAGTTGIPMYAYDVDLRAWINRSAQTGNFGVVSANGQTISFANVVVKGGYYGPVGTFPGPATNVFGYVKDQNGTALEGIYVKTSSGLSRRTAFDGSFSIANEPADPVDLRVQTSVALGSATVSASQAKVAGGTTNFGTITVTLPQTGQMSGRAMANGVASTAAVTLSGPAGAVLTPDATGSFFRTGLQPGDYTAATTFAGDAAPTTATFRVNVGRTTVILLEKSTGTGVVSIKVFLVGTDNYQVPPLTANDTNRQATVILEQPASPARTATTNAAGVVTFSNVTGAFTVSAIVESVESDGVIRSATTLPIEAAPWGQVGIPVFTISESDDAAAPGFGSISGVLKNVPPIPTGYEVTVFAESVDGSGSGSEVVLTGPDVAPPDEFFTISQLSPGTYHVRAVLSRTTGGGSTTTTHLDAVVLPFDIFVSASADTPIPTPVDFDEPSTAVAFATVPLDVRGAMATATSADVESSLLHADDFEFTFESFDFFGQNVTPPGTVSVPTTVQPFLAGNYTLSIEQELVDGSTRRHYASAPIRPQATLRFDLPVIPTVTSPAHGALLSVATAQTLDVLWSAPGSVGSAEVLVIRNTTAGQTGIAGVDNVRWVFLSPRRTTGASMPSLPSPLMGAGVEYELTLAELSFVAPYDPDYIFTFDVYANVRNLIYSDAASSSWNQQTFSTEP